MEKIELTKEEKKDIRDYLKMTNSKSQYHASLYNAVGSEGNHNTRVFVDLAVKIFKEILKKS